MMSIEWMSGVRDQKRVAALVKSGLATTGPENAFDLVVEFVAELTGADRCCITLVDADQFTYKSAAGIAEGSPPSGNVEASFCRYVVGTGQPLIVNDARHDARVLDNPAIETYNVAAWAGYPIEDMNGSIFGTLCLINTTPRSWSARDVLVLATMARSVSTEIALRKSQDELTEVSRKLENLRTNDSSSFGPRLPLDVDHLGAVEGL